MNRHHPGTTGSSGFGWLRSLLAFRHRNPVARFVSTLLAFAMATLLVVGSGAAYGDGTDATDGSAATATPSADPTPAADETGAADATSDAAAGEASAPATDGASTSGETTESSTPTVTTTSPRGETKTSPLTTTLTKFLSPNAAPVDIAVPCGDSDANALVGGFEIDGDLCVNHSGEDWDGVDFSTDSADYTVDGFDDSTSFTQGDSENNDPSTWHINGPKPNGKSDIGTAYAYSKVVGSDVFGFFAFTNTSTAGGTQQYDVEYNQNEASVNGNGATVPVRKPGDLLFRFSSTGNAPLTFTDAMKYTLNPLPAGCFAVTGSSPAGGWCTLTIPPNTFKADASDSGLFQEGSIKISAFFAAGTCSGVFGTTQIRSVTGNSFETSALKDYVFPLDVTTPSTCGALTINKVDKVTNAAVGGAVFSIIDDPRPGKTGTLCVYDGPDGSKPAKPAGCGDYYGDGAADGTISINPAEPGTYTVKEIVAPAGYLIAPAPNDSKSVTVGQSETKTLTFEDLKQWQPLTATKTASATYGVQYTWQVKKYVRAPGDISYNDVLVEQDVPTPGAGDPSAQFQYQVVASQTGATKSDYQVNGTIKVSNPNAAAVNVNLADSLSDATACTITGGASKTVPANAVNQSYAYSCSYGGGAPAANSGTNTATVTWSRASYPQSWADYNLGGNYTLSPTANYTFAADPTKVHDKVVAITDDHNSAWDTTPWTLTGVETMPFTTETRTYNRTVTGTAGTCVTSPNTATLTSQDAGNAALSTDGASAKLCAASKLAVSKNKVVSMTRTYLWQIHKSRTSAAEITSGDSADYSVTVDRAAGDGYADSGWAMTGVITVTNPNDWESITMSSLVDHFSGDNDGSNSCAVVNSRVLGTSTWGAVNLSLTAGQTREYLYSCDFTAKPDYDGTNTATATWDAATAHTAADGGSANSTSQGTAGVLTSDWELGATPVNKVITVTDSAYTGGSGAGGHTLGTVDWDDAPKTFTYSISWTAPAGECVSRPNTATIVETGQDSSASVLVCNPVDLSVSKTATGSYTRHYLWDLDKVVQAPSTVNIDSFDHTFSYLVSLKENGTQDSAWQVHGTITVTNNNTDDQIAPYDATVTDAMTGVGGSPTCRWDDNKGEPEASWPAFPAQVSVASDSHEDVDYVCSFASQPTYSGGTNKATATWTGGSASSSNVPVDFAETSSVDKTVHVYDNKVSGPYVELPNSPVTYGSHGSNAAWNAAHSAYEFSYDLALHNTTEGDPACQPFTNTAKVLGHDETVLDTDQATATICPNAGRWSVAKDNVDGDGPVNTDSDVTYRLTAHKTGGVNPKNVVLTDDLSDIAPYITGDPTFSEPAGTTVSYDSTTHVLTWTIAELGGTDRTLDFTVHVKADAYGVDLPNLVTSPGSDNCPDAEVAGAECRTDNDTPHYTLEKSSDFDGDTVMPPYLGADGTLITYTLTVHNDSDAPINGATMPGETVTDDLSDVLDNADWVGNLTPSGQAERVGNTLTWTLPEIAAGGTATLTYQVRVAGDQWDETLTNLATPGNGGDCLAAIALVAAVGDLNCTTTSVTPEYALIQALKLDADTGNPLPGAQFSLYSGTEQIPANLIGTATSDGNGVAAFGVKLRPGTFTVVETAAPTGYALPAGDGAVQSVTLTEEDMDNGETPVVETFADPPIGSLALSKAHQELSGGSWVPGDGQVAFNDQVKYVITVTATGTKVFHDVTVTDYVPGYNPADSQTQLGGFKGVIDPASVKCNAPFTCTTDYDASTGLVTWTIGNVGDETGTVEFVVRMPDLPRISPLAGPGVSFAGLMWNQAYLGWTQADDTEGASPHSMSSNEVTDAANEVLAPKQVVSPPKQHHPAVLPNTGGPDQWAFVAGLLLLVAGGALVAGDRRRRHRS